MTESWTKEQTDAWAKGTWTPAKVLALEQLEDEHIENCDECQEALETDPDTIPAGQPYYCPVGESLCEQASQAGLEYSWQPDFDPKWSQK